MKSFSNFITEKRGDQGKHGSRGPSGAERADARSNVQDPRNQTPGRGSKGGENPAGGQKPRRQSLFSRIFGTPEGDTWITRTGREGTVLGGKTPEQAEGELTSKQKERGTQPSSSKEQEKIKGFGQQLRDMQARKGQEPLDPELNRIASDRVGGVKRDTELVGTGAKPGRGQRYRQRRPSDIEATGLGGKQGRLSREADKIIRGLRSDVKADAQRLSKGRELSSRMSSGYQRTLRGDAASIIKGIGAERKAETAARKAEFKKLRYGKGKSGPATDLRTDAQTRIYRTGVQKGYFDPKTGRVSETGLQKHINMRTVGGENFGKMQGKDPRAELSRVSDSVKRAQGGDKAARREISRSYKSITAKYKPETGARTGFGSKGFRSFQQQIANVDAPKLQSQKMSMPIPGTTQRPVSSPAAQATKERVRQKLDLKLKARAAKNVAIVPAQTTAITPSPGGKMVPPTKGGKIVDQRVKPITVKDLEGPKPTPQPSTKTIKGLLEPPKTGKLPEPPKQTKVTSSNNVQQWQGPKPGTKATPTPSSPGPKVTTNFTTPGRTSQPYRWDRLTSRKVDLPKGSTLKPGRFSGTVQVGKTFNQFKKEIPYKTSLNNTIRPTKSRPSTVTPKSQPKTGPVTSKQLSKGFKEFETKMDKKSTGKFKASAAVLTGLGAYKEFGYGKQMAKQRGASDIEANIAGGLRSAGAFVGGMGGALVGRKIAGGVGALGGGGVGYTKGAEAGTWLSRKLRGL